MKVDHADAGLIAQLLNKLLFDLVGMVYPGEV